MTYALRTKPWFLEIYLNRVFGNLLSSSSSPLPEGDALGEPDENGNTPLLSAIRAGHTDIALKFINEMYVSELDFKSENENEETALIAA